MGNVQRVLRTDLPPRSTVHMIHMLGDMSFVQYIDSKALEEPHNPFALRWPEARPMLFHRGRRNGADMFSTPTHLIQNLEAQITGPAIPASVVIIGYGFTQTNNIGLGEEQPDPREVFNGLHEAVASLRQAGIHVILVSPYPMRGDKVEAAIAYAQRCEQILAEIALKTGAILAVGREDYERLKDQEYFIRPTAVHAIMRSIGLDPNSL